MGTDLPISNLRRTSLPVSPLGTGSYVDRKRRLPPTPEAPPIGARLASYAGTALSPRETDPPPETLYLLTFFRPQHLQRQLLSFRVVGIDVCVAQDFHFSRSGQLCQRLMRP